MFAESSRAKPLEKLPLFFRVGNIFGHFIKNITLTGSSKRRGASKRS
jgi:hypothetical protein